MGRNLSVTTRGVDRSTFLFPVVYHSCLADRQQWDCEPSADRSTLFYQEIWPMVSSWMCVPFVDAAHRLPPKRVPGLKPCFQRWTDISSSSGWMTLEMHDLDEIKSQINCRPERGENDARLDKFMVQADCLERSEGADVGSPQGARGGTLSC